jgi:nicotinamide mononucleotide transporter PnuC
MKVNNPFGRLTKFEWALWLVSVAVSVISFIIAPESPLSLVASVIGITSLIFIAKGMVVGQVLMIIFASIYAYISIELKYYGEAITYAGMSLPMAIFSLVSWIKHPFKESGSVKISRVGPLRAVILSVLALAVTVAFYFILGFMGNNNLIVSTFSVSTSFIAAALSFLRSPYYALGYVANDVVLMVLWFMQVLSDPSYLPVLACFTVFLANDLYGFISWRRRQREQEEDSILQNDQEKDSNFQNEQEKDSSF